MRIAYLLFSCENCNNAYFVRVGEKSKNASRSFREILDTDTAAVLCNFGFKKGKVAHKTHKNADKMQKPQVFLDFRREGREDKLSFFIQGVLYP